MTTIAAGHQGRTRRLSVILLSALALASSLLAVAPGPAAATPDLTDRSTGDAIVYEPPHSGYPDLIVESITISGSTLRARIKNQGNFYAYGFWVQNVQLSGASKQWVDGLLRAGDSVTLSFPITLCSWGGQPRGYVEADKPLETEYESNESNNKRYWSTTAQC